MHRKMAYVVMLSACVAVAASAADTKVDNVEPDRKDRERVLVKDAPPPWAQSLKDPQVLPPWSRRYGNSHGEWAGLWVEWVHAQPFDTNPMFDPNGAFQALDARTDSGKQEGEVWFLAGSTTTEPVVRHVTVPTGTALFFPLINTYWTTFTEYEYDPDGDCPPDPPEDVVTDPPFTEDGAEEFARAVLAVETAGLELRIDGTAVVMDHQELLAYRGISPVFPVWMPEDNFWAGSGWLCETYTPPAGIYPYCVADGYYVMVAPLPLGRHTIAYKGQNVSWGFSQDVTYHITVRSPRKSRTAK